MVSLDHINMSVVNLSESTEFYKNTFGFEIVEKGEHKGTPFAIIKNGESMLCMYELKKEGSPSDSETHKIFHFGLRVRDRKSWEEKIKQLELKINLEWEYPHSFSWYLDDPSGHEIEVTSWNNDTIAFG